MGLSTGSLRVYRLNEHTSSAADRSDHGHSEASTKSTRLTDLLHEEEKFSKRPIQQLAVIKEANVFVALADNHVSIHDLQT